METRKPITNPKLREAMGELRRNPTQDTQTKFLEELKTASLLAPSLFDLEIKPDAFGHLNMPKNAQIKFILVTTKEGKQFFPAFTDADEAAKLKVSPEQAKKVQLVVRTLKDYDRMVNAPRSKSDGVVINPMGENIVLNPAMLKAICSGKELNLNKQPANAPEANAVYAEPAVYPTQMVNAVHDWCVEHGEGRISRVWLKSKVVGQTMTFLLVVEAEDKTDYADAIKAVAEPLSKGIPVEVIPYSEEIEKKAVKGAFPLFDKELDV
jgi:hypothetical protein